MRMTVRPLCFAIAAALLSALPCPSLAWAANGDHGDQREHHHGHPDDHRSHGEHERELDEVVVTASPLRQRPDEVAMPVEVLSGTELDDRRAATLGESVALSAIIEGSRTPERSEFDRIRDEEGLGAAIAWREARLSKS